MYSAVISDAIFRFEKLIKENISYVFTTGTDEHGSKIQQAAQHHNISPKHYCQTISNKYRTLFGNASIEYNDFIRTTEDRHKNSVEAFWVCKQSLL